MEQAVPETIAAMKINSSVSPHFLLVLFPSPMMKRYLNQQDSDHQMKGGSVCENDHKAQWNVAD